LVETALGIKALIIEKMADIDAGKSRWIAIIIFFTLIFAIALGIFISPAAELGTLREEIKNVNKNEYKVVRIEAVAVPGTYTMTIDLELDESPGMENNWMYAYLFRDKAPTISADLKDTALTAYLKDNAFLAQKLNAGKSEIRWYVPWGSDEAKSTTFYIVLYNPDNPETEYEREFSRITISSFYEPTLPLIPITFLLLLIVVPVGIVRIYILNQKKKELRIQLSLDIENLSNEDKARLGVPIEPVRASR
jgi:hypothetical protein